MGGAAKTPATAKVFEQAQAHRAGIELMSKEAREKQREVLLRKYKPLLDEELRKIDSQFPLSGSQRSKENLVRLRTQVFIRRINLELEKKNHEFGAMSLAEMGVALKSDEDLEAGVQDAVPTAGVSKGAQNQFQSHWTPRVAPR